MDGQRVSHSASFQLPLHSVPAHLSTTPSFLTHRLCKTKRTGNCLTVDLFKLGLARFGCTNSGPFHRLMCIATKPVEYSDLFASLKRLATVIDAWNKKPQKPSLQLRDLVADLKLGIKYSGEFSGQYLAKVLLRLGLIKHPGMTQQAIMLPKSLSFKMVTDAGGHSVSCNQDKVDLAARFLKSAAAVLGVTTAVAENLLCEQHRKDKKWDFVFIGQPILSVVDIDKVPTMYKFSPDGSKVAATSMYTHTFPHARPLGRQLNHCWWLTPSAAGPPPPGMIVFTILTAEDKKMSGSKRVRFPGVPRYLQMSGAARDILIPAFISGNEKKFMDVFESFYSSSFPKMTEKGVVHPYCELARLANTGYSDTELSWKQRTHSITGGANTDDFKVLTPMELLTRYPLMLDNGLGPLVEYPNFKMVSSHIPHVQHVIVKSNSPLRRESNLLFTTQSISSQ